MSSQQLNGFLNINKPKGITSFDVCQKLKKKLNIKKIGHSGTLDPNATGVMQIALGDATKLLPILEDHNKTYLATIKFGILTDTLDPDGKIIKEEDVVNLSEAIIDEKIKESLNQTSQLPPIYSAIKVNGKKLYEYAREGKEVDIKPREVKIYEATRVGSLELKDGHFLVNVRLKVSKGFYVRSYVRDLASSLNTIAIMSDLIREEIESFNIKDSISIEDVTIDNIISIEEVFAHFYRYEAASYLVKLIKNGIELDERQLVINEPFTVYYNNKLIAIYKPYKENKYKIVKYLGD